MTNDKALKLMKIVMFIGFSMIILGHVLLSYTNITEQLGVTGYIIGASSIAIGLILSLPTKMYLTFVFVMKERQSAKTK